MRIPIACTLTADAADDRIGEWRRFLAAGSIGGFERRSDHHLRVQLDPSTRALEAVVDLAQREKACCGFFEFSIDLDADRSWLSVRVPPEASSILDDFAALLPDSR